MDDSLPIRRLTEAGMTQGELAKLEDTWRKYPNNRRQVNKFFAKLALEDIIEWLEVQRVVGHFSTIYDPVTDPIQVGLDEGIATTFIPLLQKNAPSGVGGLDEEGHQVLAQVPPSVVTGSSRTIAAPTTIQPTDHVILADATGSLPPTGLSAAAPTSGGAYTAGSYFVVFTATGGASGESLPCAEVEITVTANQQVQFTFTLPAGATGWKEYRSANPWCQGNAPALVASGSASPGSVTVTDTGTAVSAGAVPTSNGGAFFQPIRTAVGFQGILSVKAIAQNSLNTVTLTPTEGQTINRQSSYVLGSQESGAVARSVDLISDGANWRTI